MPVIVATFFCVVAMEPSYAADESTALLAAVKTEVKEEHPFFRQAFVDLDLDGRSDAIVLLRGREYCGSGGCTDDRFP